MQNEILSTLQEIRTAIYLLIAVVAIGATANILSAVVRLKDALRRDRDILFKNVAKNLLRKRSFGELIDWCQKRLSRDPRDIYALWYMAKSYYHTDEHDKAAEYFRKSSEEEPAWDRTVQAYLKKIEQAKATIEPPSEPDAPADLRR